MSTTATTTQSVITLKGSTAIVTEFFGYSINSILFQRGIYPPDTFQHVKKYGLAMLVTSDTGLRAYLSQVGDFKHISSVKTHLVCNFVAYLSTI